MSRHDYVNMHVQVNGHSKVWSVMVGVFLACLLAPYHTYKLSPKSVCNLCLGIYFLNTHPIGPQYLILLVS